jgi:hypothetical protein
MPENIEKKVLHFMVPGLTETGMGAEIGCCWWSKLLED